MKAYLFTAVTIGLLASPLVYADPYNVDKNGYSNGIEQGFAAMEGQDDSNTQGPGISRDGETMGEED